MHHSFRSVRIIEHNDIAFIIPMIFYIKGLSMILWNLERNRNILQRTHHLLQKLTHIRLVYNSLLVQSGTIVTELKLITCFFIRTHRVLWVPENSHFAEKYTEKTLHSMRLRYEVSFLRSKSDLEVCISVTVVVNARSRYIVSRL